VKPLDRDLQFFADLEATPTYRQIVDVLKGTEIPQQQLNALLAAARNYRGPAERVVQIETWAETLTRLTDPNLKSELVSTGISELDEAFDGGLEPGGVTAFVGGEAVGKSTLDKQVSYNIAKDGTKSIMVTLEGGIAGYRMPMLTLESGIAFPKMRSFWFKHSRPSANETATLKAATERLLTLPIVHSTTANTIGKIEQLLDEHPDAKVLSVDSLQLVMDPGKDGISEVEFVSKNLQRIAAERSLIVLALCEVNRVGHVVADPVFIPDGYNIRGSRQLNHDFMDTLLIARVKGSHALRIIDGKGRHRADDKGDVFLKFDGMYQTVTNGGPEMAARWERDAEQARAERGFKPQGGGSRSKPTTFTKDFGGEE